MGIQERELGAKANEAYYKLKVGLVLYLTRLEKEKGTREADKVKNFLDQRIDNQPCNYKQALTRMADKYVETNQDITQAVFSLIYSDEQQTLVKPDVLIEYLREFLPEAY